MDGDWTRFYIKFIPIKNERLMMSSKRFTDSDKYKNPFFRSLPAAYKLFWDYLYHDCNHAGIWIVDFEVAQIRIGKDVFIDKEESLKLFNEGEEELLCLIVVLNGLLSRL